MKRQLLPLCSRPGLSSDVVEDGLGYGPNALSAIKATVGVLLVTSYAGVVFALRSLSVPTCVVPVLSTAPFTDNYDDELAIQQIELDLLTNDKIQNFIQRYLKEDQGTILWQLLKEQYNALLPLMQIPFYLRLVIDEYQRNGTLPAYRATLLQDFALKLIRREERKRHPAWIDRRALHLALSQLAYAMQELGEGTTISFASAKTILPDSVTLPSGLEIDTPAADVIQLGQAATLLEELPNQEIRFSHHLLQEYFAAEEMLRYHDKGINLEHLWQVPSRIDEMPSLQPGKWNPLPGPPTTGWEQTTIIAGGLYPKLIDVVHTVNPALAARCLVEMGSTADPEQLYITRQTLLDRLQGKDANCSSKSRNGSYESALPIIHLRSRIEAGHLLGQLGDSRFKAESFNNVPVILPPLVSINPNGATIGNDLDDRNGELKEYPRHRVNLTPYHIGQYQLTNAEFACFIADGGYEREEFWTPGGRYWLQGKPVPGVESVKDYIFRKRRELQKDPQQIERLVEAGDVTERDVEIQLNLILHGTEDEISEHLHESYAVQKRTYEPRHWQEEPFANPNQPVIGICWYEAVAYTKWLSNLTDFSYRLPSEAEWEWAAHRGSRIYPWGDLWDEERCNSLEGSVMHTTPVGTYPHGATPDGICDLSGNVWEWTATKKHEYPYDSTAGLENLEASDSRIVRGGCWGANQIMMRSSYRKPFASWDRFHGLGCRLAMSINSS